jgi:peptidoglycan/LPS O-acetylase OafA/YrhL
MKRLTQLDGVRGMAILMVIVWHYFVRQTDAGLGPAVAAGRSAMGLMWSGVDLFFVLSGFLIAGILIDHRDASNYFRVFYLRRAGRILPLYILVLALFVLFASGPLSRSASFSWLFADPLPMWSYASFTQNVLMGLRGDYGPHGLGITWSLAVEEQFYLVLPLLIYVLPRRALVFALALGVASAPVLRHLSPGFHAFVNTPWRADSLLSGALLAVLVRRPSFVAAVRRRRFALASVFAVFVAGAAVLTFRPEPFGSLVHLWLAGLYSTLVLLAFLGDETPAGRVLARPALVWVGQRSYGIYLFHQAVSGLLHGAIRHRPPQIQTPADAGITLAALAVTLALAALSYRFFESPLLRLGHRLAYARAPSR